MQTIAISVAFLLQFALHVYDSLVTAGKNYGLHSAGYYALRALRTEKFFAYWGTDLLPSSTPLECGREYRVKFDVSFSVATQIDGFFNLNRQDAAINVSNASSADG